MKIYLTSSKAEQQAALEELRAEQARERAKEAARQVLALNTQVQKAVDVLLKSRSEYKRMARHLDNVINQLKEFLDEEGNIKDYAGYHNKWQELKLGAHIPTPAEFEALEIAE